MIEMLPRREVLTAIGAALVGTACVGQPPVDTLTPEQFGAYGDGITNDTAAFRALAAEIGRRGTGTILFRKAVYMVGEQRPGLPGSGFAFQPAPLLEFDGLRGPLKIVGNGAVLRCTPGLRYGSFDPATGLPHRHTMPFSDVSTRATPYTFMILIQNCAGPVEIADLELDGSVQTAVIGSPFSDVGIQIAGTGIFLRDNLGDEVLRRVTSRRHPQDGLMIDGLSDPSGGGRTRLAEDVRCDGNGRQGCSFVGGSGWTFRRCAFNRSGRGRVASPPGAGFDMEAEGRKCNRDLRFIDCEFMDNTGAGFVADTGDSAFATFLRCRFVGTSSPSIWPNKPGLKFEACRLTGTVVRCFGDSDPVRTTQFLKCIFTDDPATSPTRIVYRQGRANGSLADLASTQNVVFDKCRFIAVGGATLPWSTGAVYRDCIMRQRGTSPSYPRGSFTGRNDIQGPVDLYGSNFRGTLTLNGSPVAAR